MENFLNKSLAKKIRIFSLAISVISLIIVFVLSINDKTNFFIHYLINYIFFISISLGAIFY